MGHLKRKESKMIKAIILSFLVSWITPSVGAKDKNESAVKGSGNYVTETRKVEAYDAIELRIPANMRVSIGKPTPLTIEADDNIMSLIMTEVHKGRLIISAKRPFESKEGPNIEVTVAELKAVEVVGAGDMWVTKLDNESLSAAATGAADLHLSGKTKNLSVAVTGAADVFAYELQAQNASATLTGAADANLSVAESLNATLTGACDLNYRGNPKVTKMIIGTGDVTRTDAKAGA